MAFMPGLDILRAGVTVGRGLGRLAWPGAGVISSCICLLSSSAVEWGLGRGDPVTWLLHPLPPQVGRGDPLLSCPWRRGHLSFLFCTQEVPCSAPLRGTTPRVPVPIHPFPWNPVPPPLSSCPPSPLVPLPQSSLPHACHLSPDPSCLMSPFWGYWSSAWGWPELGPPVTAGPQLLTGYSQPLP